MRDYYAILGLSEHASAQQIKAAFRKLCMQYHPDKTGGNKALEEKFRQILAAYETLGKAERRQQYDQRRAWERAAAARPQPAQPRPQPSYPPPAGKSWSFQVNIQVPARLPKKAMIITAAVLVGFFALLYFFGPRPRNPNAPEKESMVTLPPSITAGLVPRIKDPNPVLVMPERGELRLSAFLAGNDTAHSFINMDADDVPELVAGGYLFVAGNDDKYRVAFHYDGAMYVQHNRLFLYFNDLVGAYRSCYRCAVKELANDEPVAEIRMMYDSGRVVFPEMDRRRALAILENMEYLFKRGIPPVDAQGHDDGTRKELLRHFIAFHFNQRSMAATARLFAELYTEADRDAVWHDLQQMIGTLEKRITSATVLNSYRG